MGKFKTIKGSFMRHVNQIDQMRKEDHIQFHANRQFYAFFQKNNVTAIKALQESVNAIDSKYFQVDDQGKYIMEEGKPVLIEGMLLDDYDKEYNALMMEEVECRFL